jgi:arginine/lysine/ornithine decarboxylase
MRLYDELLRISEEGRAPFHMPGHARTSPFDYLGDLYRIDFTEIDGLDNLHAASGILRDAMDHAAKVWGADSAFFLVGGSTAGMLAAVRALCPNGKPLLLARNAHRSAYHAALLNRSPVRYLSPRVHSLGFSLDIKPGAVREALDLYPDTGAVAVTSPTYDGVVSDIEGIAAVCHERGIPLLVDAAHGAHLGFLDPDIPSPVSAGADVSVMSLHKTLPAFTQTALLCLRDALADREEISAALSVFETSSPSYLLMASADGCAHRMSDPALFENWRDRIGRIRRSAGELLCVPPDVFAFDGSKLILRCPGSTGPRLAAFLRENGIEPEMTAPDYVLLMTTAGTTDEHCKLLIRALDKLPRQSSCPDSSEAAPSLPQAVLAPWSAAEKPRIKVKAEESEGRIAAEFVTPYPPGIPLLVPGERISRSVLLALGAYAGRGCGILTRGGTYDGTVLVLEESV